MTISTGKKRGRKSAAEVGAMLRQYQTNSTSSPYPPPKYLSKTEQAEWRKYAARLTTDPSDEELADFELMIHLQVLVAEEMKLIEREGNVQKNPSGVRTPNPRLIGLRDHQREIKRLSARLNTHKRESRRADNPMPRYDGTLLGFDHNDLNDRGEPRPVFNSHDKNTPSPFCRFYLLMVHYWTTGKCFDYSSIEDAKEKFDQLVADRNFHPNDHDCPLTAILEARRNVH